MQIQFKKANHIFLIFLILCFIVALLGIDTSFSTFVHTYFSLFLITFLLSLSFLIHETITLIYQKKNNHLDFNAQNKALLNKISKLSYEEKNILALFMNDKVQEKSLNPHDQAVVWLQTIKFIHATGQTNGQKKVFRIEPSLAKYLSHNPNSLY